MCVMSPTKGKIGWLTYCHHQKLLGSDAKCAKSMIRFKCLKVVDTLAWECVPVFVGPTQGPSCGQIL